MSEFPKHKESRKSGKKRTQQPQPALMVDIDVAGIEVALAGIARSFSGYNHNARDGNNSLNLFTAEHSHPLRLVLEGDAVNSIADSLKRIADVVAKQGR
jgi:hypothetical protein